MNNRDIQASWSYHNETKHTYESLRSRAHYLDWPNQPLPFKIYKSLDGIPLPQDMDFTDVPALTAMSSPQVSREKESVPDMATLAQILHFSAGITRRRDSADGMKLFFRAAACTGALYHIDLYLVCRDLPGLEAGVYHFAPNDFSLRKLRNGNYLPLLARAGGDEPSLVRAPAVVICADTYWRNSWKYQARAYRHTFWDSGTLLSNLLAIASAHSMPTRVIASFVDETVNRLLGLDGKLEAAQVLVPIGFTTPVEPEDTHSLDELLYETEPLSINEVEYPSIYEMHRASSLYTEEEVIRLHLERLEGDTNVPAGPVHPFPLSSDEPVELRTIEETIIHRGSTRQFARDSITLNQLYTILNSATTGIDADFLQPYGTTLNRLYLIVNAVEGLPSGSYLYHRDQKALELLREGDFRDTAGYLGLEQEIPADASVDVFFLTDLQSVLAKYGNRGYRMAQLEAGILGGRLYLGAYAQRLGASGLTFYDDEVIEFFSPSAEDMSIMFLVALGRSIPRKR